MTHNGHLDARTRAPTVENGQPDLRDEAPGGVVAAKQAIQLRAAGTHAAGQRDRGEHGRARRTDVGISCQQALLGQPAQPVGDRARLQRGEPGHLGGRFGGERRDEHRHPAQQRPIPRLQQVMAPVQHRPHRPVPVVGAVVPMAGVVGVAGSVASTAIITAGSMSSNVKAKDSLEFNLTMQKVADNSEVLAKKYAAKAKSNGEDIITPLIEQMAQDTIDAATGKTVDPAVPDK